MVDVVPERILERIGRAYERAASRAAERYQHWSVDEEYATGAVGGTKEELVKGPAVIDGQTFQWRTDTWPVRGKGPNGREREYGADAVIELVLLDEGGNKIAGKILPVQNKNERIYDADKLADQASRISRLPGGGLVVRFSEQGFECCEAGVVADVKGDWGRIPQDQIFGFGRALSRDFLWCKIGTRDMTYDSRRQRFQTSDGRDIRFPVRRRSRTTVKRRRRT